MEVLVRFALCVVACCLGASVARAEAPSLVTKSYKVSVGATLTIGTFGQHNAKTCEHIGSGSIRITKYPSLGGVSTTDYQPFVLKNSISGTCIGSQQLGTKVDYLAKGAGNDNFEFDVVFNNGTMHYIVNTTNH